MPNPKENTIDLTYQLGVSLIGAGEFAKGIDALKEAVRLGADSPSIHNDLGVGYLHLRRLDDALDAFNRALVLNPRFIHSLMARGGLLYELKRYEEAVTDFETVLQIDPESIVALCNSGTLCHEIGKTDEAIEIFNRALVIDPNHTMSLCNAGLTAARAERYFEALSYFERLVKVDPKFNYALGYLFQLKANCGDWSDYDALVKRIIHCLNNNLCIATPATLLAADLTPKEELCCARMHAERQFPKSSHRFAARNKSNEKIRLAYVSPDYYNHATSCLTAGLFEAHDRSRFEVIAVSCGRDDGLDMRRRLEQTFDQFICVEGMSDFHAAELISAANIDIAISLQTSTSTSRLGILAHRPASIQVNYLAHPGTLGTSFFDYILADGIVIPEQDVEHYAEKVVYLPHSYQVNDCNQVIANDSMSRADYGLPPEQFVFCCMNDSYKITPAIFGIWMRLLNRVPQSVLWLYSKQMGVQKALEAQAEKHGVSAHRLIFAKPLQHALHLARYQLADLFLDTLPCNAHTTASDALWSGLPLLTCKGRSFKGRVAASLLNAIGLPELVTNNLHAYEELAYKLATDKSLFSSIKEKLRERRTVFPLFNTRLFCNNIEAAYGTIWEAYCRGESPTNFSVVTQSA